MDFLLFNESKKNKKKDMIPQVSIISGQSETFPQRSAFNSLF